MTFSCWAKFEGADDTNYTLAANSQASPIKFSFRYYAAVSAGSRYLRLQYFASNNVAQNLNITPKDLNDGNWHHLVFTIDGTTNANGISMYIDNEKTSFTANNTGINSNSGAGYNTLIGAYQTSTTWDMNGPMSNAAFWDSSLSTSQINDLYNNGQPEAAISHSPLSYYKLDNTASGIQDNGSASNNGTMVGTVPEVQTNVWTPRLNGESTTLPSTALVSSDLQFESPYSNFSLNFDGVKYIIIGSSTELDNVPSNPYSFSFWFKSCPSRS